MSWHFDGSKTTLERAFELARSGRFLSVGELRTAIRREGYLAMQLDGPALSRQLAEIIRASKVKH